MRSNPEAFPPRLRFLLEPFQHRITRRILPIPSSTSSLRPARDGRWCHRVEANQQESVFTCLGRGGDRDFLPEGEVSDGELGAYAVSLSFPQAVDARCR